MCSSHTLWDQYDPLPAQRRGTFGKPLEGVFHKIIDPDTGESLPPGEEGEVWVRGYPLMQGLFMTITLAVLGANALADLAVWLLDPRTRG